MVLNLIWIPILVVVIFEYKTRVSIKINSFDYIRQITKLQRYLSFKELTIWQNWSLNGENIFNHSLEVSFYRNNETPVSLATDINLFSYSWKLKSSIWLGVDERKTMFSENIESCWNLWCQSSNSVLNLLPSIFVIWIWWY